MEIEYFTILTIVLSWVVNRKGESTSHLIIKMHDAILHM